MSRSAPQTTDRGEQDTPAQLPFHSIDEKTRKKLQEIRQRVPRYLFRAWSNTQPRLSGGFANLNSTDAIVPLAFRSGCGHSSVYDMKKDEMLKMVLKHLEYHKDFSTGFSSWTASLTYAMMFFGNDTRDVYISVVDTKAMQHQNDIFFVPDLSLLTNKANTKWRLTLMHHEYLVYGKVCGPFHRAVRLDEFINAGFDLQSRTMLEPKTMQRNPKPITVCEIQSARKVANQYGYHFTIPMTLALLSLQKREPNVFLREDSTDFGQILAGLNNVRVPHSWSNDDTIMGDTVYIGIYQDVRQLIQLMRAAVRYEARVRSRHYELPNEDSDRIGRDESSAQNQAADSGSENAHGTSTPKCRATPATRKSPQRKWFIRFNKGKAKLVQRDCQTGLQGPTTRSLARVVKTGGSRTILKIDAAAIHRTMKGLSIDMNRPRRNDNGGRDEVGDIEMGEG